MIQRVQSIFISLYIIIKFYLLYTYSPKINSFHFFVHDFDLFSLLLILIIIFSITTLLSFKKRITQIKLLYILMTIQLIIIFLIFVLAYRNGNSLKYLLNHQTFLYLFGLFLLLLSLRGIKRDQKLIDSIDRIR